MIEEALAGPYAILIKLGIVLLAAVAIFFGGYYKGYEAKTNSVKAAISDHILKQAKAQPAETKIIHDTVTKIRTVHDKVYVYVTKFVPDNRACDVPAAGVGLLNRNRALPPAR